MADMTAELEASVFMMTAFHEAGHAVVGHRSGLVVQAIDVVVDDVDNATGATTWDPDAFDARDDSVALAAAAGALAEQHFQWTIQDHNFSMRFSNPDEILPHKYQWIELSESDERAIDRWLSLNSFSGYTRRKAKIEVVASARELVKKHWDEIVAVAKSLVENSVDHRDGRQVSRLTRAQFLAALGES